MNEHVSPFARAAVLTSGILDAAWYRRTYPDVAEAGVDPLHHYLAQGWTEGRDPGPLFSTRWYLRRHRDVAEASVNPLVHYLTAGWREGRQPSPALDPQRYLAEHPELGDVDVCPLVHLAATRQAGVDPVTTRADRPVEWTVDDLRTRSALPADAPPVDSPLRIVAYYLPQFHRVPENDEWWGEGFTEWTNVRRGRPRFAGHHQPHVPLRDLGFYDLDDPAVLRRQVDLARRHGVTAFCFYAYWFGGRRLLHTPLDRFTADTSLDLEFMICWANEPWTRAWDGRAGEVLIDQVHTPDDDVAFIAHHARYFADPRYIRIGGCPVLSVYRPAALPDPAATVARWREWCREHGIGEIHLIAVHGAEAVDPLGWGFDAAAEFPPNNAGVSDLTEEVAPSGYSGRVYDWTELVDRARCYEDPGYPLYRAVCPSWDSEARRPGWGTLLHGSTPALFREWLSLAATDTRARFADSSQQLVFVNAWNEWAEGCHLEPDERYGYQWLHAVRDVQVSCVGPAERERPVTVPAGRAESPPVRVPLDVPGLVVVTHDLQRHGAQMLALELARFYSRHGVPVEVVALGGGPLEQDFRDVTVLHVLDRASVSARGRARVARDLFDRGHRTALVNSVASGAFVGDLKDAGFHVIGLVHELPQVMADQALEESATQLVRGCDRVVFPSETVRAAFPGSAALDSATVSVRPQGLYRTSLLRIQDEDRAEARRRLEIPDDVPVVVACGFGDYRKGFDRFVELARIADSRGWPAHFVWVGATDEHDERLAEARGLVERLPRLRVTGFVDDPTDHYAAASVFVLTSREDPYPSVVLEAMASGLAVAAVDGRTGVGDLLREADCVPVPDDRLHHLLDRVFEKSGGVAADDAARRRSLVRHRHAFNRYCWDLLDGSPSHVARVSVIVPSYDYARYLPERLESILGQTHPVYEVLVYDDASTDSSPELAERLLGEQDVAWRVSRRQRNSGSPYSAWTRAAAEAGGDIVWIAEADDVADAGLLRRLAPLVMRDGAVMAFAQSRAVDDNGRGDGSDYSSYLKRFAPTWQWDEPFVAAGEHVVADVLTVFNPVLNVSSAVFDVTSLRAAVLACGAETARLPTVGDWLVYAATLSRGSLAFVPDVLNDHRRHDRGVIGVASPGQHLSEVVEAQRFVASIAPPTDDALMRAGMFRDHVAQSAGAPA